jgi:hypothetical protein
MKTMKAYVEIVVLLATCLSAGFWIASAMSRLTRIGPGQDALDKVTILADDLRKMSNWNTLAAAMMGVTAILEVLERFL